MGNQVFNLLVLKIGSELMLFSYQIWLFRARMDSNRNNKINTTKAPPVEGMPLSIYKISQKSADFKELTAGDIAYGACVGHTAFNSITADRTDIYSGCRQVSTVLNCFKSF